MSPDSARRPFNRCPSALQSPQPFAPVPRRLAGFVASPSKTTLQAVRRSAHVRARLKRAVRFASRPRPVCNAISGKRPATWRPCNRSGLSAISGNRSTVRQSIRQHRTRRTCRALQPFRPVSISTVRRQCHILPMSHFATIERAAPIPANVAGYCPPSVQPLPVRLAIVATVRASPATFGRIRRQSIENGLASRPPRRPCPRPSETRRALCKPSATVCNAISGKRPQPWRTSRQACPSRHH